MAIDERHDADPRSGKSKLRVYRDLRDILSAKIIQIERSGQTDDVELDTKQRVEGAREAVSEILHFLSACINEDVAGALISKSDGSPTQCRDSLLSWLKLMAPLINGLGETKTPYVTPGQLAERLSAVKEEFLQNALWAPYSAREEDSEKGAAIDRLRAFMVERHCTRRGFDKEVVRSFIKEYYGADWDTIRKWHASAKKILDIETYTLVSAPQYLPILFTKDNNESMLEMCIYLLGSDYRRRQGLRYIKPFDSETGAQEWIDAHGEARSKAPDED